MPFTSGRRWDGGRLATCSVGQPDLFGWLRAPDEHRGLHVRKATAGTFTDSRGSIGEWSFASYRELAQMARRMAFGLARRGVGPGDVVSVVLPGSYAFVSAFFGTLLVGATPSPVAPPVAYQDGEAYRRHLSGVLAASGPALIVAPEQLVDPLVGLIGDHAGRLVASPESLLAAAKPTVGAPSVNPDGNGRTGPVAASTQGHPDIDALRVAPAPVPEPFSEGASVPLPELLLEPAALALVQFTSGSSGLSKGVPLTCRAVEANIGAIGRWLGFGPSEAVASWLPVHHDMGLIGCLLAPICHQMDVWLLEPQDFIRDPVEYLRCFSEHGATLTAMPSFGISHVLRKLGADPSPPIDLSGLRAVVLGAERTDLDLVRRAAAELRPMGLGRGALVPAYGLAEATLAVSGVVPGSDLGALGAGDGGQWAPVPLRIAPSHGVVSCGLPLDGLEVEVVSETGVSVRSGHVGEIVVRGDSVADRYWGGANPLSATRFADGQLFTGDAGVVVDSELYVFGRQGDAMKIRGRSVFAEDLELALIHHGLRPGQVVVSLGHSVGQPTVVVVVERGEGVDEPDGLREVVGRLVPEAAVTIRSVARGGIERTSSGKPKRRLMWERHHPGRIDVEQHGSELRS